MRLIGIILLSCLFFLLFTSNFELKTLSGEKVLMDKTEIF